MSFSLNQSAQEFKSFIRVNVHAPLAIIFSGKGEQEKTIERLGVYAIPFLLRAAAKDDGGRSSYALYILDKTVGRAGPASVPFLLKEAERSLEKERASGHGSKKCAYYSLLYFYSLSMVEKIREESFDMLLTLIKKGDFMGYCSDQLAKSTRAAEAIPYLVSRIRVEDHMDVWPLRASLETMDFAYYLRKMPESVTIPALIEMLSSSQAFQRIKPEDGAPIRLSDSILCAISEIVDMKRSTASRRAILNAALCNPSPDVRSSLGKFLIALDKKAAGEIAIIQLGDPDGSVALSALANAIHLNLHSGAIRFFRGKLRTSPIDQRFAIMATIEKLRETMPKKKIPASTPQNDPAELESLDLKRKSFPHPQASTAPPNGAPSMNLPKMAGTRLA